jgi:hypothetical protein
MDMGTEPKGEIMDTVFRTRAFACLLGMAGVSGMVDPAAAAPPGWSTQLPVTVVENSDEALIDYQVRLVLDTASLIAAGYMKLDASDLRFGTDAAGTQLLDYWIEGGVNTPSTVVWIRLPLIPASGAANLYLFTGNPAAASASTLSVFDYEGDVENSATNQIFGGTVGGVTNSQRGFRFMPNEDVLLVRFGKNEPSGTTRYITLFDVQTQAILAQTQVAGAAGTYVYADAPQPIWLTQGTQYILEIYQGAADGYYFGPNGTQINPRLTYLDMRYCNGCTQDTFPQNFLTAIHYGYADFQFMTRQHAAIEPTATQSAWTPTVQLVSTGPSVPGSPVTFTATVLGAPEAATGLVAFLDSATPIAGCESVALDAAEPPTATCTTSDFTAGTHVITAQYGGDAVHAASSATLEQIVNPFETMTALASSGTVAPTEPVVLTATVSGEGAPTGNVLFLADSSPISGCEDVPLDAGTPATAVCTTSDLALGDHLIEAQYGGDVENAASSGTLQQTIAPHVTATLLGTSCMTSFVEGQLVTLQAAVQGGSGVTGSIAFFDDAAGPLGSFPVNSGVATYIGGGFVLADDEPMQLHLFRAEYSGDVRNASSTSAWLPMTVLNENEAIMRNGFDIAPVGCPTH